MSTNLGEASRARTVHLYHLGRRFFASLSDERPSPTEDHWIRGFLLPGEANLWTRMSPRDQRHSVDVARKVVARLPEVGRPVMAAAILHDVGKLVSGYRTFARVGATLFWGLVPRRRRVRLAHRWGSGSGLARVAAVRRLAEYRLHPELGRDLLEQAGSDEFTSQWAAQHHTPMDNWTVDTELGLVLKECDDD